MRILLSVFAIALSFSSFGQTNATTEDGKKVILNKNGTWKYVTENKTPSSNKVSFKKESSDGNPPTFSTKVSNFVKTTSADVYMISGDVMIKNGHDEDVKVSFSSSVSKVKWDEYVKNKGYSDIDAFELVASMLSLDARYNLKNSDSFVPLPKQFFMSSNSDNAFIANFKMMGRNGYGNLIESTSLVSYDPSK